MQGYIHQLESFGCADGPGSRFIIFFAGCPFRCLYCHNPDTWEMTKGKLYSADELLSEAEGCRDFWGKKGGITVSGGEPLAQID
ncbi:MAG: 4Fe-4S cluster-binding domain-containing protein, partial [Treponema sp.]|nr:4Fe-4S cluster-binding domain-containing protein [Treponema sp.]